ncbi:MAG: hypothetical protein ACFE9S_17465 [Candidatus Hermodarchaeota archaeon]
MENDDDIHGLIKKSRGKLWLDHLNEIICKKFNEFSNLEFKNALILTLSIWDDNFIDNYFVNINRKDNLKKILKIYAKLA